MEDGCGVWGKGGGRVEVGWGWGIGGGRVKGVERGWVVL